MVCHLCGTSGSIWRKKLRRKVRKEKSSTFFRRFKHFSTWTFFLDSNFLWKQLFIAPKFFLDPKFLRWTFFGQSIIEPFLSKIFKTHNFLMFLDQKTFGLKICIYCFIFPYNSFSPTSFFDLNFFGTKFVRTNEVEK